MVIYTIGFGVVGMKSLVEARRLILDCGERSTYGMAGDDEPRGARLPGLRPVRPGLLMPPASGESACPL